MENDLPSKWTIKEGRMTILISNKVDFKTKILRQEKEGHFILIKGTIKRK
jgi:hypothetical protein